MTTDPLGLEDFNFDEEIRVKGIDVVFRRPVRRLRVTATDLSYSEDVFNGWGPGEEKFNDKPIEPPDRLYRRHLIGRADLDQDYLAVIGDKKSTLDHDRMSNLPGQRLARVPVHTGDCDPAEALEQCDLCHGKGKSRNTGRRSWAEWLHG